MAVDYVETQIPVSQLQIGMHVIRLDRPWIETSFLLQGFIIQSEDELLELREQCEFVFIEGIVEREAALDERAPVAPQAAKASSQVTITITGSSAAKKQVPQHKAEQRVRYINKVSVESEMEFAMGAFQQARAMAKSLMDGIRMGVMLDMNQARQVVAQCVESVLRNQDALLWLTHIKRKDEYTAEHSMNVAILSAAFAKHLGLVESEIEAVALCGLLHDVGKTKVPAAILNKEGALTPEEFAVMQQHPTYGRDILMSTPGCEHIAVDVAYSHHERVIGTGYPRKLQHHQIPYYAKIVALTDAYDAITSNRCYAKGRSSKDALDIIYRCRGEQFDEELALEFIQCIGVFPPGSIVEMSTGEVGIVVASCDRNKLRPRVILLLNEDKQPRCERVVDLMKADLDASGQPYSIKREWSNGSFGINLQDYLDKGLVLQVGKGQSVPN